MGCLFPKQKVDDLKNKKSYVRRRPTEAEDLTSHLKPGYLFCDKEFQASGESIWYNAATRLQDNRDIVWKRAKDIVKEPYLLTAEDTSQKYFPVQGELGDW